MSLIKNSIIISGARFFNRGLGLLSTLIVARILSPEDYGVIAACMLAQDLGRRFSQLGINQNLVSSKDTSRDLQDSLYAQRIIVSTLISVVIFILAPFVAIWLNDDRITDVLKILCWVFFFNSIVNFNCLIEVKNNNFKPELIALTVSKVCQVSVTIGCAYYFHNYWALVAGIMTAAVIQCLVSYFVIHPYYIHRVSVTKIVSNLSYSKWFLGRELVDYINAKLAQIVAGMYFSSLLLGFFSVGRDLCLMLALEVSAALDKSNLSYLSTLIRTDGILNMKVVIIDNIKKVLFFKNIIVVPFYFCLFVHPELFVKIILGNGWLDMAPYCRLFACISLFMSYNTTFTTIFDCIRKPHITLVATLISLCVAIIFAIPAVVYDKPILLIFCTLFAIMVNMLWYLYNLKRVLEIGKKEIFDCIKSTVILLSLSSFVMLLSLSFGFHEIIEVVLYLLLYLVALYAVARVSNEEYQLKPFLVIKNKVLGG